MNAEPVIAESTFQIPASRIWKAITETSEMGKWYFDIPGFRAIPGYEFRFQGGGPEERQYTHICRIIEVIKERRISYSWEYAGFDGSSIVTFDLEEENGNTRLTIKHEGLETFHQNKNTDFNWVNFQAGWNQIMISLSTHLEKNSIISMG